MKTSSSGHHSPLSTSYGALLLICCSVSFVCYFGSYMRMPIVPLYAHSLGASTVEVGMINSAFLLMAGLLSIPLGMVSDRVGRKLLASLGLLILAGTSFLLYFSATPTELMLVYVCFGVGLAAFGPTMMSIIADISPPTHLGRSYGWYTTALYSGMSFGPATGGYIAQELGYLKVFALSGVVILITFFLLLVFLPRSQTAHSTRLAQDADSGSTKSLFNNLPLLACWLATFGGCIGLGMFITFLPLHAQNQGLSLKYIGLLFSAQGLANAVCRIPFGHLSDRVANRKSLVTIGLIGFTGSLAGFGAATSAVHFTIFSITVGISMALAFTSVGALIAEVVPAKSRGLAMGGYNACIYLGMMASSAAMGAVIRRFGFQAGFMVTALVNLLVIVLFHLIMKGFRSAAELEAIANG